MATDRDDDMHNVFFALAALCLGLGAVAVWGGYPVIGGIGILWSFFLGLAGFFFWRDAVKSRIKARGTYGD